MRIDLLDKILESNTLLSKEEFKNLMEEMKKDQVGFITDETDPIVAKKKNIAKTIFQSLFPYSEQNYIVEKPETDHLKVLFLGTAAGGCAVTQRDRTGGIIFQSGDKRVHVDPGPSAVRDCEDYSNYTGENWDPILTDVLILTHNHIDHAGGLEEYIETFIPLSDAIAKEKVVIGNRTVIYGNPKFDQGPRLDKYKKNKLKLVKALTPNKTQRIDDVEIKAIKAEHIEAYDPITNKKSDDCLGFVLETPYGTIGITGDTEYSYSMLDDFTDVDYLIAFIVEERSRAGGEPERYSLKDINKIISGELHIQFLGELGVRGLIKEIKPTVCLLTHYGDQMATFEDNILVYKSIPELVAKRIENDTGVKTIPCLNGMMLELEKKIKTEINKEYFISSNRLCSNKLS